MVTEEAAKHPDKPVEVWATDEHRIGLKPIIRRVWAPKGQRPIALGHHRYKWLYVTAFVQPISGEVFWSVSNGVSKPFFAALLALFAREAGAGRDRIIVLGLDSAGWHTAPNLVVPGRPDQSEIAGGPAAMVDAGPVYVFDRDPGLGDNHQRQFFGRGHTVRGHPEGRDHDEMRSAHCIPQGDLSLEASRHAAMQVLAEQEGVVRQVLDDELVARAGGRKLLDLVRRLQEMLADHEPVPLAGHALRPAIEPSFLPEVVQRGFQRELGGVRFDAVALTRSRRRRRFPAGAQRLSRAAGR